VVEIDAVLKIIRGPYSKGSKSCGHSSPALLANLTKKPLFDFFLKVGLQNENTAFCSEIKIYNKSLTVIIYTRRSFSLDPIYKSSIASK
jgi:hypothetical protein